MTRRIISLFIFMNISCIGALHLYSQEVKRYETQNDMPLFDQKMKERLTYPLSFDKSDKPVKQWRKDARAVLMECISPLPPKAASYDMKVVDEEKRKGYKAQKVEFNISDYSRTTAYILIPDGKGPFPAVLLLHDHGAHFSIGKEKMIRPFNTDSLTIADADTIVFFNVKDIFLEASCCMVLVVNGGAGVLFFVPFFTSVTMYFPSFTSFNISLT